MMTHCVLLNADYTFLNLVNWKRAICLMAKGKVEVVKDSQRTIRNASGVELKIPAVMRLIKLIRTIYRTSVTFTKRNVLIRDHFRCAYCGASNERLSIDHIIPKSKGGKMKKGGRTPREARMYLKIKPYQPTISEFLRLKFESLGIHDVLRELGVF